MDTRTLEIKRVPLDSLHLDPANARTHGEQNLETIQASLQRFGQAEPLVVHAGTGRVIGGNGRLVAMRKIGWTECDVVQLDIDDLQATALAIALNRTAELATWDEPALGRLLEELRAEDSLDGIGFGLHVHDIHASILHLMGLDRLKLSYSHQGRLERPTINEGEMIHELLG